MFGYAAPAGGAAWQDVQERRVSGDPAAWHTVHAGAAATGGLPQGFLFALAFGLGTVPALLLVGSASALLSPRLRGALYRAGGVVVVAVGALFLARGLGLHAPV